MPGAGITPGGELIPIAVDGIWEADLSVWGLQKGQMYELWFKAENGWISAGTFRVSSVETRHFHMTAGARTLTITEIMVTAEEDDGVAAPSRRIVLTGTSSNR